MIKRFVYWIVGMCKREHGCKCFCVSCEYYDICRVEKG